MKLVEQILPGTFVLEPERFVDQRGAFVKTYHEDVWRALGIGFEMREEFYSTSRAGVIRGMHFHAPPHAHDKVVYCLSGGVLDVLLDLRQGPGYGRAVSTILSAENRRMLFIPVGVAHGFKALADDSLLVYKTSTVHTPASDRAIRWDSFGFDWDIESPILSDRDRSHAPLAEFDKQMFSKL